MTEMTAVATAEMTDATEITEPVNNNGTTQSLEEDESLETTLIEVLQGRAATYALLTRFFRTEVDEEFLAILRNTRFPADTGVDSMDRGHRMIVSYLSQAEPDVLTQLAIDYSRTFLGGGNDAYSAAYPFESVYTSPKRLMMQNARDEILALYRAAGLEKLESSKEAEDHLSYELEFMEILIDRSVEALEKNDEELAVSFLQQQRNFLNDHLMRWYPMMAKDIAKFSRTGFYKGVGEVTLGFLASDFEFLNELLGYTEEDEEN